MPEEILSLVDGQDVMAEIKKFAEENNIEYGLFVSAKGGIRDLDLIAAKSESRQKMGQSFEVSGISGKIQKVRGKYEITVRLSGSTTGFTSLSGKLIDGTVSRTLDIVIRKVNIGKIIEA
jgi:predicted DNA-binding protein with PD1-like motif